MIPDQAVTGFESGDALDTCVPSGTLAGLADAITRDGRLAELDDDELIEAMRAWERLRSWARANRLAAVAELRRRSALRPGQARHCKGRVLGAGAQNAPT
jgi:hypothetical protein